MKNNISFCNSKVVLWAKFEWEAVNQKVNLIISEIRLGWEGRYGERVLERDVGRKQITGRENKIPICSAVGLCLWSKQKVSGLSCSELGLLDGESKKQLNSWSRESPSFLESEETVEDENDKIKHKEVGHSLKGMRSRTAKNSRQKSGCCNKFTFPHKYIVASPFLLLRSRGLFLCVHRNGLESI